QAPVVATFEIRLRPKPELYAKANDPALLVRELRRLGQATVTCDSSDVPLLPQLDAEGAYLTWTIRLETEASEQTIREVFEFVDGDCDLDISEVLPEAEDDGFDVAALLARMSAELGDTGQTEPTDASSATEPVVEAPVAVVPNAEMPAKVVDLADTRQA